MPEVIGFLNLHNAPYLGQINQNRALAAVSFLGRYAICDIPLSNLTNSEISNIGVLVNRSPRSMIMHIGSGKQYTVNTKKGKTVICFNEKYANNPHYNTDINNIIENKWFLDEANSKYVVIVPTHLLYRLDFRKVIEQHKKSNADCTLVYKHITDGRNQFIDENILLLNDKKKVINITKNKGLVEDINVSMETIIISTEKLREIISFASKTSSFLSLMDVIRYICNTIDVDTFEYDGYLRSINSLHRYMECSLELLDFNILNELFDSKWPIYTKTHDTPPASYLENAWVRNSFISNGAVIDGKVENSVVCRDVKIGKNCVIRNSIVLSGTSIADEAILENVIVDKNAKILYVKELRGTKENPLYIGLGDVI
ncbi:MAG: glucose-1-phosphate adenylyltransferase subunit GlgD [Bacilli bacterium]